MKPFAWVLCPRHASGPVCGSSPAMPGEVLQFQKYDREWLVMLLWVTLLSVSLAFSIFLLFCAEMLLQITRHGTSLSCLSPILQSSYLLISPAICRQGKFLARHLLIQRTQPWNGVSADHYGSAEIIFVRSYYDSCGLLRSSTALRDNSGNHSFHQRGSWVPPSGAFSSA